MNRRILARSFVAAVILCAILAPARADDWPQFRGAQRDGVWRETGILTNLPAAGLDIRWRTKVGQGYSGPSVAGGRVFLTDHVFEPGELERVLCFDEKAGAPLWVHSYPCDYKDMEYGSGPRATPTVHDGKVYTLGTQGHLACLDAATGQAVWAKSLVKDFNGTIPRYGASAAPLVVGDLLIVCAGGQPDASVVALDRLTGELRWKALPDRAAYSAPIVITAGGCEQVIVWTADSINSFDAPTGKLHWQVPRKSTFDPAEVVALAVRHKDLLLCMGAWSRGSVMLKLDPEKPAATVLWETRTKPTTMISTPIFQDDDHFYASLGNGSMACLEAATGREVWSTKARDGTAHLTPNGGQVFLFNHTGHLILARLTAQKYEEIGRAQLVEPTAGYRPQGPLTWAHPAYANRCVFARNDRELVCASLAAEGAIAAAPAPPSNQTSTPSRTLAGLPEGIAALAVSSNGKALAVGSSAWPSAAKLIDLASGKELAALKPLTDSLSAVALSPDGRLLVAAGGNEFKPARNGGKTTGQIKVLDVTTGKELTDLTGHTNRIFAAAFSPDSQTLATGGADLTIRLWDVVSLKSRAVLEGHTDAIRSLAFSPDGRMLVSGGADRTVRFWDATSGLNHTTLKAHGDEVRAVAFSPDGKTLATGCADWSVQLWNITAIPKLESIPAPSQLKGHRGGVLCLAFSADGRTLATGSGDETVKLWDVAAGKERATLRGHRSGVSAVAFSPDGKTLISAGMDDAVRVWEIGGSK